MLIKLNNAFTGDRLLTEEFDPDTTVREVAWELRQKLGIKTRGKTIRLVLDVQELAHETAIQDIGANEFDVVIVGQLHAITSSTDGTVRVWDLSNSECHLCLTDRKEGGHGWHHVRFAKISEDGTLVVTGAVDSKAKVWSLQTGECLYTLDKHTGHVVTSSFSPDCRRILSCGGTANVWNTRNGKLEFTLEEDGVRQVQYSNDGRFILGHCLGGSCKLWCATTGALLYTLLEGPTINLKESDRLKTLIAKPNDAVCTGDYSISPDSSLVATTWHGLRFWCTSTGRCLASCRPLDVGHITTALFAPNSQLVAVASSRNATLTLWSIKGELLHTLGEHVLLVTNLEFSNDGEVLLTGSADGKSHLWNTATGDMEFDLRGHRVSMGVVGISPDGQYMITRALDGNSRVWSRKTGETLIILAEDRPVTSACFSEDGKWLLTGALDGRTQLLDPKTGVVLQQLPGHKGWVFTTEFFM